MSGKLNLSTDEAVAEIIKLIAELKNLDNTLGKMSKGNVAEFNKMTNSMSGFKAKITELNNSITRLSGITKTNSQRLTKNSNEVRRNANLTKTNSKNKRANTRAIGTNTKALNRSTTSTTRNTKATKKATIAGAGMLRGLGKLAGALGFAGVIATIGTLLLSTIRLTIKFQSLGYAIKQTSETVFEAGRSSQFLIELNNKFGASLVSTTERWLKFRTAARQSGLTLLATKDIFTSVTKASAVLGLQTDELRGVYLALEQMLSKGKVTTEELRRQLGERLPGAMGIMASSMNVSIRQLDKMLKKGEVLSAEVLPAFARELERAYGIESLETVDNLATGVGKLTGQWQQFISVISEGESLVSRGIGGAMGKIESALSKLTILSASLDQKGKRVQSFFNPDVLKEYSDRSNKIINDNKEFAQTETYWLNEKKYILNQLRDAQKAGASEDAKILKTRLKGVEKEIRSIEKRRQELEQVDASVRLEDEVNKTEKLRKKLIEAGEDTKGFMQNWKDLAYLLDEFSNDNVVQIDEDGKRIPTEALTEYERILRTLTPLQKEFYEQREREAVTRELAEMPSASDIPLDEDGGVQKQIKNAKIFLAKNRELILMNKHKIAVEQELFDKEGAGHEARTINAEKIRNLTELNLELEKEDRDTDILERSINEKAKWDEVQTRFDKESPKYLEQMAQHAKAIENIDKESKEELSISVTKYYADLTQADRDNYQKTLQIRDGRNNDERDRLAADSAMQIAALEKKLRNTAKGSADEAALLMELDELKVELFNREIDRQIAELKLKKLNNPDEADFWQTQIDAAEALKQEFQNLDEQFLEGKGSWEIWAGKGIEVMSEIGGLFNALSDAKIKKIDEEIDKTNEYYDNLIDRAKNDEEEKKIIERNREIALKGLEERKRKEQIKQAKFAKAIAIQEATLNMAVAISAALKDGLILTGITAGIAAIQLATVLATPIPTFAQGGVMGWDGKALINDGGNQEYVERDGSILSSGKENAVVDLKKGDIIHKDFDTLKRKSMMLSLMMGGSEPNQKELNLALGIKDEIKRGFNEAKINNKVTILNKTEDYKNRVSAW